jgi:hypothetical protein
MKFEIVVSAFWHSEADVQEVCSKRGGKGSNYFEAHCAAWISSGIDID